MVTVLLANKHRLIRQALAHILSQEPTIKVLGDADGQDELCQKAVKLKPDIIVLDSFQPAAYDHRDTSLLISTQEPQLVVWPQHKEGAAKASEISYDADVNDLISLIKKTSKKQQKRVLPLTKREKEILQLVAEGLSNKQISSSLLISERTVKYHIGNILRKLNLSSRLEAAIYFHKGTLFS